MIKKILPDLIAIVTFVIVSIAYFFPADIEGRILFQQDSAEGIGAGEEAKQYHEATGKTTRWTNALFGGMPTYQIAPSYDSTRVLSLSERAYRLFLPDYVQLVFIMMLGFYILLRAFGLSPWLSGLGGIMWAFSSYFFIIISAGHIWKFITLAYVPPTLAGIVWAYRGKLLTGGVLTAIFLALQIKSNHVQMSYYFLFVILFIVGAYFEEAWKNKTLKKFLQASAVLVIAAMIGVAANLSNLYHTYTYSKETMRGKSELVQTDKKMKQTSSGLDRDYITQWSYGISETLTLLVPNYKGGASVPLNRSEKAMTKAVPEYSSLYTQLGQYFGDQPGTSGPVYVGAFVLFLFVLGCLILKGPMKWALIGATMFSILLSWGKNFMFLTDFFIDYVPMYNKFRAVSSILVVAEFTIPLMAAFTLKKILEEPQILQQEAKKVCGCFVAFVLICIGFWLTPTVFDTMISAQESAMLHNAVAQKMIPSNELAGILSNLTDMRAELVSSDAVRSLVIIIVGCGFIFAYVKGRLRKEFTILGVTLLCLVDMWGINKRYLDDSQFVSADVKTTNFKMSETDKLILEDKALDYRVLNLASNTFNENNTSYFHKSVGGYHAAKLRRYQELIEKHITGEMQNVFDEIMKANGKIDSVDATRFRVLNMLNTRYFIFPMDKQGATAPVRNPFAYGNAWFVSNVKYVANANEEIDALNEVMPNETAIVDNRFKATLHDATTLQTDSTCQIILENYEPNELTYKTSNKQDGVAIFSEIYYPDGWKVQIDGKETVLGRADYVLRTLYVPAGEHTITMVFNPTSLQVTETIAYVALVLMLVGIIALIVIPLLGRKLRN